MSVLHVQLSICSTASGELLLVFMLALAELIMVSLHTTQRHAQVSLFFCRTAGKVKTCTQGRCLLLPWNRQAQHCSRHVTINSEKLFFACLSNLLLKEQNTNYLSLSPRKPWCVFCLFVVCFGLVLLLFINFK